MFSKDATKGAGYERTVEKFEDVGISNFEKSDDLPESG